MNRTRDSLSMRIQESYLRFSLDPCLVVPERGRDKEETDARHSLENSLKDLNAFDPHKSDT
jgi:hypothetical protein